MFERFEPESRRLMAHARDEAWALRHDYLGTEHVLLSMLREGDTLAGRALSRHVDLEASHREIRSRLSPGNLEDRLGQLPFTPSMKRALEETFSEAQHLGDDAIVGIHLLLGILHTPNTRAQRALESVGVDPDALRDTAYEILGVDEADRRPAGSRRAYSRRMVVMYLVLTTLAIAIAVALKAIL